MRATTLMAAALGVSGLAASITWAGGGPFPPAGFGRPRAGGMSAPAHRQAVTYRVDTRARRDTVTRVGVQPRNLLIAFRGPADPPRCDDAVARIGDHLDKAER